MGNENKIKKVPVKRTEVFFRENAVAVAERPHLYSLETEFAKAKKQKNRVFYISAVVFGIALVAATIIITNQIQEQSSDIRIDVSDFRDLNLTDLLQSTKREEGQLRSLLQEIADIRANWQMEQGKIQDRYRTEREILQISQLSAADRQAALNRLAAGEYRENATVNARFAGQIAEREREVAGIRKRLASQDKKLVQGAQAMELVLDSQLKVIELERKKIDDGWRKRVDEMQTRYRNEIDEQRKLQRKLAESLVLRYNPIIRERDIARILPRAVVALPQTPGVAVYPAAFAREGVVERTAFEALRTGIREERTLLERLFRVQYTNSVAPALFAIAERQRTTVDGYERLWGSLLNRIEQKNSQILAYNRALNALMRQTREHGYVLDAANPGRMPVVINESYAVRAGDTAFVIRGDNNRIGSVRLERGPDGFVAVPVGDFSLAPAVMDKLLLQLR